MRVAALELCAIRGNAVAASRQNDGGEGLGGLCRRSPRALERSRPEFRCVGDAQPRPNTWVCAAKPLSTSGISRVTFTADLMSDSRYDAGPPGRRQSGRGSLEGGSLEGGSGFTWRDRWRRPCRGLPHSRIKSLANCPPGANLARKSGDLDRQRLRGIVKDLPRHDAGTPSVTGVC